MSQPKTKPRRKTTSSKEFTIKIPVKPYVKRFLELNFGDPVYFHIDKEDYNELRRCLNKSRRWDNKYSKFLCTYRETVTVLLSEDDFYRFGWDMTATNVVRFNSRFEKNAKTLMRSMVGIYNALGLPMNVSITKFQDKFYFDENCWHYETIRKDFQRRGYVEKIDFENEIFNKVERIVLDNLYKTGTISHSYLIDHDNDK